MNKFEAFGCFLTQKPIMALYIIINVFLIFFMVKLSLEPLGVPLIDEALKQVPWWMINFELLVLTILNIFFLYNNFKKWCNIEGF